MFQCSLPFNNMLPAFAKLQNAKSPVATQLKDDGEFEPKTLRLQHCSTCGFYYGKYVDTS
jgi:hypothetical protein